jgi:hypothetical protein
MMAESRKEVVTICQNSYCKDQAHVVPRFIERTIHHAI